MIERIRDIQVVGCIYGYASWSIELRSGANSIDATADLHRTCDGGGDTGRRDPSNDVVTSICNVYISCGIDGDSDRRIEARHVLWAVGAANNSHGAGERAHAAASIDLTDRVVARVGHINISRSIGCDPGRHSESCCCSDGIDRTWPTGIAGNQGQTSLTKGRNSYQEGKEEYQQPGPYRFLPPKD
nr:hypothetical protein [Noviherbaspirillum saxi]